MHVELVWAHGAGTTLTQSVGAGDEYGIANPDSVSIEHHPGGGDVGNHHLHHPDGQRDLEAVEALVDPVVDGPIGERLAKHRRQVSSRLSSPLMLR